MVRTEDRLRTPSALLPSASRSHPGAFAVDVNDLVGETVLKLRGELDISTQPLFASTLASVGETAARIVLDLSDLTFIDCGSIRLFHRTRILAGLRGTCLELRDPNPQLLRILELTGLLPSSGNGLRPIVVTARSREPREENRSTHDIGHS